MTTQKTEKTNHDELVPYYSLVGMLGGSREVEALISQYPDCPIKKTVGGGFYVRHGHLRAWIIKHNIPTETTMRFRGGRWVI